MELSTVKEVKQLEERLIGMMQRSDLELQAMKLQETPLEDKTQRELILEDMNARLKDMREIMLLLYKLN